MSGNDVLARRDLHITHIEKVPSGRAIAVVYKDIRINVYAQSGTAKRTEREHFYNVELPILFAYNKHPLLIGGDFNCVLHPVDSTGHFINSKALAETGRSLRLTDMSEHNIPHTLNTPPQGPRDWTVSTCPKTIKGGKWG